MADVSVRKVLSGTRPPRLLGRRSVETGAKPKLLEGVAAFQGRSTIPVLT